MNLTSDVLYQMKLKSPKYIIHSI